MRTLSLLVSLVLLLPCGLSGRGMISNYIHVTKDWDRLERDSGLIRMEVAFDQNFTQFEDQWIGLKTPLYCRWTNAGTSSVKFLLKEHDSYLGELDYPWGLEIRITDEAGKVRTGGEGGWWSRAYFSSQMGKIERRDTVTLKPGERIVRKVQLSAVAGWLPSPRSGRFKLEVRMGAIQCTRPLTLRLSSDQVCSESICLETAFDSAFTKREDEWVGPNVSVFCRWTNTGTKPSEILLFEKDSNGKALGFPDFLEVRLTKEGGEPAEDSGDGWRSGARSTMGWDLVGRDALVTLQPGQSIVREIQLTELLGRNEHSKRLLGTYLIEMRFGVLRTAPPLTLRMGPEYWRADAVAPAP